MATSSKPNQISDLSTIFPPDSLAAMVDDYVSEIYESWNRDPASAAEIQHLSQEQFQRAQENQKVHLRLLFDRNLDDAKWQIAATRLGQQNFRNGIPLHWISESYRKYAEWLTAEIASHSLSQIQSSELCSDLTARLFHDLAMQTSAYAEGMEAGYQLREIPVELDHLLLTAASTAALYPRLTEFLSKIPGVDGAWLGRPDEQGFIHYHAVAGSDTAEYLDGGRIQLDHNPESPLARAWKTGQTQFASDWTDHREIRLQPFWQERAMQFGWRSSCAIPVTGTGGQRDALVLYSKQTNFFSQNEIRQLIAHLQSVLGVKLERLRLLEALAKQQETLSIYKTGMDASQNGILISNAEIDDLPISYVNPAFERITGYSAEEAIGRNCRFLQGSDTEQPQLEIVRNALRKGEPCAVELRNYRKNGTMFWNSLTIAPVRNKTGAISHFIGIQADITDLKIIIRENSRATSLYRALMSAAELVIRAQSERELLDDLCRVLVESGLFPHVWIGKPNASGEIEVLSIFSTLNSTEDWYRPNVYTDDPDRILSVRAWRRSKLQYTNDRLSDPEYPAIQDFYRQHELHATAVVPLYRNGELWALLTLLSHETNIFGPELLELLERIGRLIGHGLDSLDLRQILDEERRHQSWLARHDPLTDVLNRRGVLERLEEAVSRARRHDRLLALAVMDLDGFKAVNDMHGHTAGDMLLRTVAERLQSTLRQTDAVGRLGGDEFVLILEDLDHEEDLAITLSRLQAAVETPIDLSNGRFIVVRSSIGVTLFPQDDSTPERLLRHADRALDAWKEKKDDSGQRWMVFQPQADEQKYVRRKNILSLFRAGNLRIHYQPMVDLQTGKVVGVEALARLLDSQGSLLPPAEFISQLSAADLVTLTHQVLAQSVNDLSRIDRAGFELSVGVNLEPTTLADPTAVNDLCHQIENSGLAPGRIILELLERADTLSLAGSKQALRDLKTSGARIALDDVGSAYSSLLRVKELPADIIKLDRSFLIGLEQHPKELRFLMNLVHLAQALGLDLVAEGIESHAGRDALAALGVRHGQGYSIARPMSADDLLAWLQRQKPVLWTQPTTVLGAVALQLCDLDATTRILEQRPSFLQHLLTRDADWEGAMRSGIPATEPGALELLAAHRAWHETMTTLSAKSDGRVNLRTFQEARSDYEDKMFQAAFAAHQRTQ